MSRKRAFGVFWAMGEKMETSRYDFYGALSQFDIT